jgi:hypothetical protein
MSKDRSVEVVEVDSAGYWRNIPIQRAEGRSSQTPLEGTVGELGGFISFRGSELVQ